MTTKEIGKITSARFGRGGYQDAMFGISIGLGSDKGGWGVGDFKGTWDLDTKVDRHTRWTEEDRDAEFAKTMRFISELLKQSKRDDVSKLVGVPVEVTFDGGLLKSWRVLEEAL